MLTRYIVSAIIVNNESVLLGQKAQGRPPYPNAWHLPGGGVEDSVLAEKCILAGDFENSYFHEELRREVREEVGIEIKDIACIVPTYRATVREAETLNKDGLPTHYYFLEYLCQPAPGTPKAGDDLVSLRWFSKKELATISLTPPSQEMYHELGWL